MVYRTKHPWTTFGTSGLPQAEATQSELGLFTPASHDTDYSLFAPLHYERGYAYPLLVWLHSPGSNNERQLLKIMPIISMRNYVAVAPRGFATEPSSSGSAAASEPQYDWPQTPGYIDEAERRVFESIQSAFHKLNIAPHRVFIAGYDAGGAMALRIAMAHPERFAGVLSLCGAFPRRHCPLRSLNRARNMPVLLAVGRDSTAYPPGLACEDLRLFHAAGLTVSLRQYPCGQQLAPEMLRDVDRWIMEEITSPGRTA